MSAAQAPARAPDTTAAQDVATVADALLNAGRYADTASAEFPELSLRAAVNTASGTHTATALDALADYLTPGWRENGAWAGPGQVVDAWQRRAPRPLNPAAVLSAAAHEVAQGWPR
jgi:hypothetical protein